jgi:hypothetical protein
MTTTSHIRRLALIAVISCAILAAWSSAALARPIDDPALRTATSTAAASSQPRTGSAGHDSDWALPIALGGAVALIAVGTAGYAYRTHTSRRAIA